jgi:tetratricopeptide (TPR) repeat protein
VAKDSQLQHDLSISYFRLGHILDKMGSPDDALGLLDDARRMQATLRQKQPQNASRISDLADTENAIGVVQSTLRKFRLAETYFDRAHDARKTLVERYPENREYQRKLANTLMNLSVVYQETDRLAKARSYLENAQQKRECLLKDEPDSEILRRDLAKGYYNLARIELASRDHPENEEDPQAWNEHHRRARGHVARSIKELEGLLDKLPPESPWVRSDRYKLAVCYHLAGRVAWESGPVAEAESRYDQARRLLKWLADAYPDAPRYRESLARVCLDNGVVYEDREDDRSLAMYGAARNILAPLVEKYPKVPDYRTNLAAALLAIGRLHVKHARLGEAADVIYQSIEHARHLKASFPGRSEYEQKFKDSLEQLVRVAKAYSDRGEQRKAIECVERGLQLDPDNEQLLELLKRLQDIDSPSGVPSAS